MPLRIIAQIVVQGGQIVSRALARAVQAEYQTIKQARTHTARREGEQSAAASNNLGMSIQEATDILAVDKMEKAHIQERYDHMYKANAKKNGGSFYLQSKVFRAKERLDEEIVSKSAPPPPAAEEKG